MNIKQKVFVGLSGGVDSSVSASLLKDQGYDVSGVFIKGWEIPGLPCSNTEDRRDAMRVATKLAIPFYTLDLSKEYKQEVVDYLLLSYQKGETPNPDILCNQKIKFGYFLDWAKKQGADKIATGHYAKIEADSTGQINLLQSQDSHKDQTYFLWSLNQTQLKNVLFPVGHLVKSEVRRIAELKDLITAFKKDSQGVCFLGQFKMKDFLKKYLDLQPGLVVNQAGGIIGEHEGVNLYTLGQRHGFTISESNINRPIYYVVAKDVKKNQLIVAVTTKSSSQSKVLNLKAINWINHKPQENKTYLARYRHGQSLILCQLSYNNDTWQAEFDQLKLDVASGQSLVIYDENKCLGGGIII